MSINWFIISDLISSALGYSGTFAVPRFVDLYLGKMISRVLLVVVWTLDGALAFRGMTATAKYPSRALPMLHARKGKGKEIDPFDPEGIDGYVWTCAHTNFPTLRDGAG